MALFSPSESPAVVVKEIDLTGGVPNVQSTTGAIVGNYRWGPVEKRTLIANETELVETFASPDSSNTVDFHSASFFLRYSSNLQVVRAITSTAENAFSTTRATKLTGQEVIIGDSSNNSTTTITNGATFVADSANTLRLAVAAAAHLAQDVVIKNEDHFDGQLAALSNLTTSPVISFVDSDHDSDFNIQINAGSLNFNDTTNSATRMSINSSGNVGIGNTSPNSLLNIHGVFETNSFDSYSGSGGRFSS